MASISIVCMTINRPWITTWQKALWAQSAVHLIIADGTASRAAGRQSAKFGELRYTEIALPGSTYLDRLRAASAVVDTEFVALIDDEEAYSALGLRWAAQFLEQNPDYSCVSGAPASLEVRDGRLRLQGWRGRLLDWTSDLDLCHEAPIERIEAMLRENRSANVFYSLTRSQVLQKVATYESHIDFEGWHSGFEYLWTTALLAAGKYRMAHHPFLVRAGGSHARTALREVPLDEEVDALIDWIGISSRDRFISTLDRHREHWGSSSERVRSLPPSRREQFRYPMADYELAINDYLAAFESGTEYHDDLRRIVCVALELHKNLEGN